MIDKAMEFAVKAHAGQVRKGSKKPYIVHPVEVADIVTYMTQDKEIICAALLHDTIEDCKGVTKEIIEKEFGKRVADIVAGESEDKSKTWKERKSYTIEKLKTESVEVQIVALADKLSNLRSIDRDILLVGDEIWNIFKMKDKDIIGWYYKGVRDSLEKSLGQYDAFKEYSALVDKVFG